MGTTLPNFILRCMVPMRTRPDPIFPNIVGVKRSLVKAKSKKLNLQMYIFFLPVKMLLMKGIPQELGPLVAKLFLKKSLLRWTMIRGKGEPKTEISLHL